MEYQNKVHFHFYHVFSNSLALTDTPDTLSLLINSFFITGVLSNTLSQTLTN